MVQIKNPTIANDGGYPQQMTKEQKIKQIMKEVLLEIKPTKELEKETLKKVEEFLKEINKRLKENKLKAKAMLGGSFAKGTWVNGDYDVDIFVKFSEFTATRLIQENLNLSDMLEKIIKQIKINYQRVHGSRDYFLIKKEDISYEIIPVLDIKKQNEAKNITDFSPWHVDWVNTKGKKFKNDIMLLKKFLKAQKIYGAENYIKGFSGHVVDILTIYYEGFVPLLKDAQTWKAKKIIDKKNVYKGKALLTMNKSKTEGPLVLVDPVMAERNAAAAVDDNCFEQFVKASKKILKTPTKKFFEEETANLEKLSEKGHLIKLQIAALEGKEDVVGTKILKVHEYLKEKIADFGIAESGWEWDKQEKAVLWYVLSKEKLEGKIEIAGPPLSIKEHVLAFKKKHKKTFEKTGRIYALEEREFSTPEETIEKLIQEKYVKEKVKNILLLRLHPKIR